MLTAPAVAENTLPTISTGNNSCNVDTKTIFVTPSGIRAAPNITTIKRGAAQ